MPRPRTTWALLRAAGIAAALALALVAIPEATASRLVSTARPSLPVLGQAASRHAMALKMIWGPVTLPNGQSAFPTYHTLGVRVLQLELDWAATASARPANAQDPNDPAYQWPVDVDRAVVQAAQYGIKLCLLVHGSPPWANGNRPETWAPDNPGDYADFLVAAAHRYGSVGYWMIWGEPNRVGDPNFQPMPANSPVGPRRYALVLSAAYHALKQVSSANIVIGGNTWSFGTVEPADFVRWMKLPNGKPPPLDYYGHNPFGRRFPDLSQPPYFPGGRDINDIDTLEKQLRGIYHRRVMLWLSEFTISSTHGNRAFNFAVSRKRQAQWVTAAFQLVNSVRYVAGLGWFGLLDQAPPGPQSLTTGLMTSNLQPKPAFYAYEHAR